MQSSIPCLRGEALVGETNSRFAGPRAAGRAGPDRAETRPLRYARKSSDPVSSRMTR